MKEVTLLEKKLEESDKELNNTKIENENNIRELKISNKKYNEDYNDLNNKSLKMEEEIISLKKQNELLSNNNKNLSNDNELLLDEQKNNKELLLSYEDNMNKLNQENLSLKKVIEEYKNEIEELRKADNSNKIQIKEKDDINTNNNIIEDEIVIVKKETFYSKGPDGFFGEFGNNDRIKNEIIVKKKVDLKDNEILKYNDIIQDLCSMLLIYENYFFRKGVKPKNNRELLCLLLVEYIEKKIKRIKLNALINLIIYKYTIPKKNNEENDNSIDIEIKEDYISKQIFTKGERNQNKNK
jgi:hypothetical protein